MAGKDLKKLLDALFEQGWRVDQLKNNHYKAYPPDVSKAAVVIASTPSDRRAWANTIALLRRSGFNA